VEGSKIAISAPLGDQTRPVVAYNSQEREFLVVWQDQRAGNWDIYGQLVRWGGLQFVDSFSICSDPADQSLPDVAYNPDTNQYLVVWQDPRDGNPDIYGQRVEGSGNLDGGNFAIASAGTTGRRHPRTTFNPVSGEFFVVYTFVDGNGDIRGRRVPAAGPPTEAAVPIATGTTVQDYPDVACRSLGSYGGYLVVWRDRDGAQRDVRGIRLNSSGSTLGAILEVCTETHSQWTPRVAYSPESDRYLVTWPDDRNSATQGRNIYGRQVGGAGTLHSEFPISTAALDQLRVDVAYAAGLHSYVVAWDDGRGPAAPDIYAQRVSPDGELEETASDANTLLFEYSGWQQFPAVAWGGGELNGLLVWQDGRNADNFDVFGLILGPDTTVFLPLVIKGN
jgi:hypothetical protein